MITYDISSRGYLHRARGLLDDGRVESLFYAAFELRCGIEARLHEYLDAQAHIAEQERNGWRVEKLSAGLKRAFQGEAGVVELRVIDRDTEGELLVLYYTPVDPALRSASQALDVLLHAARKGREEDDPWWGKKREQLENTFARLEEANKGTLLGPPLMHKKTGRINVKIEIVGDELQRKFANRYWLGRGHRLEIKHLDRFPAQRGEPTV